MRAQAQFGDGQNLRRDSPPPDDSYFQTTTKWEKKAQTHSQFYLWSSCVWLLVVAVVCCVRHTTHR